MKLKTKIIAGTATLAFLAFAGGNLQAANQVTNLLTITAAIQEQGGTNINANSGVTTVAAPTKFAMNTKQILAFLAKDEFAAGSYSATNFPAGAKLVALVSDVGDDYQVVDKHNGFLVDVSNIIKFSTGAQIYSGKTKDFLGNVLGYPTVTRLQAATMVYDDSAITNGVKFKCNMIGLMKRTATYTVPTLHNPATTVTTSARMVSFTGAGTNQVTPFIITGSLNAAGRGTFR